MSCSSCALNTCLYADNIILGLPMAATASIGAGFSYLEASENVAASSVGAIGNRVFTVATLAAGTILIAYNLAKVIFAHLLNLATLGCIQPLKDFVAFTETELMGSTAAVILLTVTSLFGKTIIDGLTEGAECISAGVEVISQLMDEGSDLLPAILQNISDNGVEGLIEALTTGTDSTTSSDSDEEIESDEEAELGGPSSTENAATEGDQSVHAPSSPQDGIVP